MTTVTSMLTKNWVPLGVWLGTTLVPLTAIERIDDVLMPLRERERGQLRIEIGLGRARLTNREAAE